MKVNFLISSLHCLLKNFLECLCLPPSSGTKNGIRTFRSPLFFPPRSESSQWDLRSQERKFPGTFTRGNECSRMFPGTFIPDMVSSLSDHGKGCWRCSESKSKLENKSIVPCWTMHTGRILSRAYAAIREWS